LRIFRDAALKILAVDKPQLRFFALPGEKSDQNPTI